jgi:hypothetical protein
VAVATDEIKYSHETTQQQLLPLSHQPNNPPGNQGAAVKDVTASRGKALAIGKQKERSSLV